jgi:hypothetical protein
MIARASLCAATRTLAGKVFISLVHYLLDRV